MSRACQLRLLAAVFAAAAAGGVAGGANAEGTKLRCLVAALPLPAAPPPPELLCRRAALPRVRWGLQGATTTRGVMLQSCPSSSFV